MIVVREHRIEPGASATAEQQFQQI